MDELTAYRFPNLMPWSPGNIPAHWYSFSIDPEWFISEYSFIPVVKSINTHLETRGILEGGALL